MSIKVVTLIWDHAPVSGNELLLLLAIADQANDLGRDAWPSIETLARKTRLNPRTVQRLIRRLTSSGLLSIERGGGRRSNKYTVDLTLLHGTATQIPSQPSESPAGQHPRRSATGDTRTIPEAAKPDHPSYGTATSSDPSCTTLSPSSPARGPHPIPTADAIDSLAKAASEIARHIGTLTPLSITDQDELTKSVLAALSAGHDKDQLLTLLSRSLDGARSPLAVIHARLRRQRTTPNATQPTATWPEWCGSCDGPEPHRRLVQLNETQVRACPNCHPRFSESPMKQSGHGRSSSEGDLK